ncbi:hypothetical protein [Flaviaesturariibacter amylovorans]|uniref:DUF3108 domain-containing protein n=1 Tax=Flaviaesturariibacter amylovorans TaxID=1084520 RepID=A0ABP8GJ10_9BACT
MIRIWPLLFLLFLSLPGRAQDVNGYWYGTGNVENGGSSNNYMFEVLLEQNGSSLKAIVNYYFKNSFRSFRINGSFNRQSRQVELFNIPITYFNSPVHLEVDCPMDFVGQLRVSQVSSNIRGSFQGRKGYQNTCPPIVFDLKQNKDAGNRDSVIAAIAQYREQHQFWTPTAYDTLVAATVIQRPVVNYVVANEFLKRQTEVAGQADVQRDTVSVDFYDNGEVDGDSISVFFNGQLLTFNRLLGTKAIHFDLVLDPNREVNEISMFANNLGRYPPNTALMVVWDGKKQHEIRLASSLDRNATVRIKKKRKPDTAPK